MIRQDVCKVHSKDMCTHWGNIQIQGMFFYLAANEVKADAILYADKAVAIGAEVIAVGAAGHFLYTV